MLILFDIISKYSTEMTSSFLYNTHTEIHSHPSIYEARLLYKCHLIIYQVAEYIEEEKNPNDCSIYGRIFTKHTVQSHDY